MHEMPPTSIVLIVVSVLLFFFLGIAIVVLMDHKARMPGGFKHDLFSISGMRRDHPVVAFLTTTILLGIITVLVLSLVGALSAKLGLFAEPAPAQLLSQLGAERNAERLRHFHNLPEVHKPVLGKKNVCFYCHGDYPHSKEPMIRTLMNMHTQFLGCMTCHVDEKKIAEETLTLRWLNYSGNIVSGPPYGTVMDTETGYLAETDDYYSKIVAYSVLKDEETLLEITGDDRRAKEFIAIHRELTDYDREALKKTFHKLVASKGRRCSRCHTQEDKSYLPFRNLGFSSERIYDLTNLDIIGLVEKYTTFHLPRLTPGEQQASPQQTKQPSNIRKDPRTWWKEKYDAPANKSK